MSISFFLSVFLNFIHLMRIEIEIFSFNLNDFEKKITRLNKTI